MAVKAETKENIVLSHKQAFWLVETQPVGSDAKTNFLPQAFPQGFRIVDGFTDQWPGQQRLTAVKVYFDISPAVVEEQIQPASRGLPAHRLL
jgi:hypothetical protein